MNVFRTCGAVLASLAVIAMPMTATAQSASAAFQVVGPDSGVWAEKAGVEKIAEGVWLAPSEWEMLRQYGCTVGPQGLVSDFLARMDDKGHAPCSPKWYGGLSKVNKQGTQLFSIRRSPAGYMVAESDKGINLTPNFGQWSLYSFDSRSIGRPVSIANTTAPSGAMVTADLFKTALGATLNGTGAALVGGLMNPCRGGNGCGDTWNIQGGQGGEAAAIAATETSTTTVTNFDAVIGGGTGPCTNCGSGSGGHGNNKP